MLNYIEYLNIPSKVAIVLVVLFFTLQAIGEFLSFKGKAVPEIINLRKYFARKKAERETIRKMPEMMGEVKSLLDDVKKHYSEDNIAMRDDWIKSVNKRLEKNDKFVKDINEKLVENGKDITSILIDNKRNDIINFASHVIDENYDVTREQFNRIFRIYEEYEQIIKERNLTNGEVDIALRIIQESYENHMKNHSFVEDVRGYGIN